MEPKLHTKPSLPDPNADTCIRFRYRLKILQKRWVLVESFSMAVSRSITRWWKSIQRNTKLWPWKAENAFLPWNRLEAMRIFALPWILSRRDLWDVSQIDNATDQHEPELKEQLDITRSCHALLISRQRRRYMVTIAIGILIWRCLQWRRSGHDEGGSNLPVCIKCT